MADPSSPFEAVWLGLWEMVEAHSTLTDLVRGNNRIKFLDNLGPKKQISHGDLPELALLSSGGDLSLISTSTSSKITRTYVWMITTGDYNINKIYNDLVWELFRAMLQWDTTLCALEWPLNSDWHYVTDTRTYTLDEGTAQADQNRGIEGWAAMLYVDVDMHFRTSTLRI